MKIGADNKKQVKLMVVLLAIAIPLLLYNFRDQLFGGNASAASSVPVAPPPKPGVLQAQDDQDARLHLPELWRSQKVTYEAGRNIFHMEEIEIGKTITDVRSQQPPRPWWVEQPPTPTPTPPPPPIPLNYYGFASGVGSKKIFLQQKRPPNAEGPPPELFVAGLGDIVDRRYRVVQIQANSVTMEDMLTKNQEKIPVTVK